MYSTMIFQRPSIEDNVIVETFGLEFLHANERTAIYGNKSMRFSFDKSVIRVLLYDGENFELADKIEDFFYGEYDDKGIH